MKKTVVFSMLMLIFFGVGAQEKEMVTKTG